MQTIQPRLTQGRHRELNRQIKTQRKTKHLKQEINFPHELGENLILVITFGVEQGREKECVDYIEAGMAANLQGNTNNLSPMQALFQRPKNKGSVELESFPGKVIITYKFPSQNLEDIQEGFVYLQQISSSFTIDAELKGHVAHNNKNRTAVKIDYTFIDIESDKMQPEQLLNLAQQIQPEFGANPIFRMIGSAKRVNLDLHTNSFRKIKGFFEKCKVGQGQIQHPTKDFPYVAPGILKSKAQFTLFYKNVFGVYAKADYHSEEVFLRLIKVYSVFLTKGLDF